LAVLVVLVGPTAAHALPLRFTEPAHQGTGDTPVSIATGDFDVDGDIDLATANQDGDSVSVLRGTAAGSFGGRVDTVVGDGPRAVAAGRFDGGGDLDLAVANFSADTVSVLVGGSGSEFTRQPTDVPVGNGPRAIATGLFNAGTDLDLAVANEHTDNVSVLVGGPDAGFSGSATFAAGGSPSGIVAADFNGDGDADLAVANLATDDVSVLVGATGATFLPKTDFAAGDGPRALVAGDFNGDGDPDLAVANENTDDVSVLLGGAGAGFSAPSDFASGDAPTGVATADFTRDGDLDLVVTNRQADNVSVLRGRSGGGFSAPLQFGAGNGSWAIATGDFNADGEQDLVASNAGSDDVSRMLNITAPDTTVASGPTGVINDPTPAFGLAADEQGALFECRVDGEPFAACGQLFTSPLLADGPHLFEAVAIDPAGNRDATPAGRAVTVDTVAPDTSITAGPAGVSRDSVQRFAFAADEAGARFECRVDAGPFAGCATGFTTPALADGAHAFAVRAVDPAGNADPVPAARDFAIDTTPPETTIVRGPAGRTTDLTPTWRFTSSERASTFECRIDKAAFAPCASPFTASGRKRGAHRFRVRARDAAGNVDANPASRRYRSLLLIRSRIGHVWAYNARGTTLVRLIVKDLPAAARIALRCRGAGCPFRRTVVKPRRGRRAVLTGRFRGARLAPGTVVEIRITAPDAIGKVSRFTIRSNDVPTLADRCLAPGRKRPVKCKKVLG
jgi:predicted NUDIX family NTP pyrophosphohydrolase